LKASTGLEKAQLASTYPASVMAVIAPLKSLILLDMEVWAPIRIGSMKAFNACMKLRVSVLELGNIEY